ncbi:hypothetical protein [Paenibacillus polymyxa]|uniref:hypothetical protein n=1 Tax=Paenibacillus polymyxa TaxID=1406 RepID=UPI0008460F44|nr:hypothetical protein [Paenibacillus polymyxa]AOK88303.1 hypothetical protein AOU00_00040 [Paenibacillus polymyxa]
MNSYERSDPFMVFGDGASAALYMKGQRQGQQTLASVMRVDGSYTIWLQIVFNYITQRFI